MGLRLAWTAEQDKAILDMRAAGVPWKLVAAACRVSCHSVIDRARGLGVPKRTTVAPPAVPAPALAAERSPLPAGHPDAWIILTAGTLLQGVPYDASGEARP